MVKEMDKIEKGQPYPDSNLPGAPLASGGGLIGSEKGKMNGRKRWRTTKCRKLSIMKRSRRDE